MKSNKCVKKNTRNENNTEYLPIISYVSTSAYNLDNVSIIYLMIDKLGTIDTMTANRMRDETRGDTHRASTFGRGCMAGRPIELPVLCQEACCLFQKRCHIQLVPFHHFLTLNEHILNVTKQ